MQAAVYFANCLYKSGQTSGIQDTYGHGHRAKQRADGDVVADKFFRCAFNHHRGGKIHQNLNHCRGKAPQDKIDETDAVGNAGRERQTKSDQRAAERQGAGKVAVFNQPQFFRRGNPQIHRAENGSHRYTCKHILQVKQILGQGNTHDMKSLGFDIMDYATTLSHLKLKGTHHKPALP